MAAPASAAPRAASAICSAVTGRCGDIDGVWIEPVTAQVIMTLLALATFHSLSVRSDPKQTPGDCDSPITDGRACRRCAGAKALPGVSVSTHAANRLQKGCKK